MGKALRHDWPMNWLLIAGGLLFTPTPATVETQEYATINHTLAGEPIPAKEVVTRNRWGTPMLPDGTGGYSLIQPIVPEYIARSLIQPPRTSGPIFRPAPRE
jgi:hypothetical protein